jgi:hypothetical protein
MPLARPLTCAVVGSGSSPSKLLKPDAMTELNVEPVLTSQV